jgi:hypothetical protein
MAGLRNTLLATKERDQRQHELAQRIAAGDISPGGTDYMEPDSDEDMNDAE